MREIGVAHGAAPVASTQALTPIALCALFFVLCRRKALHRQRSVDLRLLLFATFASLCLRVDSDAHSYIVLFSTICYVASSL